MNTILNNVVKYTLKVVLSVVPIVLILMGLIYLFTTIYIFPPSLPFSGNHIYNPYQELPDSSFKANFHAHSKAWKGITHGGNTEKEIFDAYIERGYDVATISNYHNISTYAKDKTDLYFPGYEHGYNILKSHYLVINAENVSFFDFPMWQSSSHQQYVLNKIKEKNKFVAIAHPKFGGGRSLEDMQKLVNYDFTEVLNHYRVSDEYWDHGLSAGRLSWIIGNDDIHATSDDPIFRIWNIIHANERNQDIIMSSLKAGKNYAIESYNTQTENLLLSCQMKDSVTFAIRLRNIADSIQIIGQGGNLKKSVIQSDTIQYSFQHDDSYLRVVVHNSQSRLYLNPLVRYDGFALPYDVAKELKVDQVATWSIRASIFMGILLLLYMVKSIWI